MTVKKELHVNLRNFVNFINVIVIEKNILI